MIQAQTTARKRKKPAPRDYSAVAEQFEADVLSGRFPACSIFKAAVEKQRREVAKPPAGYAFSAEEGDKFCRRAERFPFGGEGPERGTPFFLQPWQVWLFRTLFGWRDSVTGQRRFREASLWIPKGNGKSPLAALMALCILVVGKGGEKLYSAASTQKQARLVFDSARELLNIDADNAIAEGRRSIKEHFGIIVEEHKIKGAVDSRVYEPVSSESGTIEGVRPYVLILDEVHVLPNRKLYGNLQTAANKVEGSLFVTISTAGMDMSPDSLGYSLYCRARDIILGSVDEPTTFALIIEADRKRPDGSDANPLDFEVWRQANPNLGVSVSIAGLQKAMRTWRDSPVERPDLEVKHLGWWQQASSQFLDVRRWNELADPSLSLDDCDPSEWAVVLGIDLARTRDLTALVVLAVRQMEDGNREYRVFTRNVYIAENSPTLKLLPEIEKRWSKDGWIEILPKMTYGPLKAKAVEIAQRYGNVEACIDRWAAAEVESDLEAGGLTVVDVGQGAQSLSEPMKELEAAIIDGRLHHDGSPVAALCAGNLQAKRDENGNIKPTRENEYKKIDVMAALIDALYRGMVIDLPSPMGLDWV